MLLAIGGLWRMATVNTKMFRRILWVGFQLLTVSFFMLLAFMSGIRFAAPEESGNLPWTEVIGGYILVASSMLALTAWSWFSDISKSQ